MNVDTGEIIPAQEVLKKTLKEQRGYVPVTDNAFNCFCGSGQAFANCCFTKIQKLPRATRRRIIRKKFGMSLKEVNNLTKVT